MNYVVVEVKKTHRKPPAVSFVPKSASQTTPSTAVQLPAATFSQRPTPKPRGDGLGGVVGRDTPTTPGGAILQAPPILGGTTLGVATLQAPPILGGVKLGGATLGGALTTTPMPSTILGRTAQIPPTLHGTLGVATLQAPPILGGVKLGGATLGGALTTTPMPSTILGRTAQIPPTLHGTLGVATLQAPPILGGATLGGVKLGGATLGGALTTTPMPSTILGRTAQIPPTLHGTLGGAIPAPARSSGIERSQVPQRQFGFQPFAPVVQQVTATTQSPQPPQDKKTSSPPIFKIVNVVVKSSIR